VRILQPVPAWWLQGPRDRFPFTNSCGTRTHERDGNRARSLVCALSLALCIVLGTLASQGASPAKAKNPESGEELKALLERLQQDWPGGVQRNSSGEVVSVMFSSRAVGERDLSLLASIETLEKLVIGGGADHPGCVTEEGISVLASAPRFRSLTLQCFGELPTSVLAEVSRLRQLEELHLAAAFPKESTGYTTLTNLVALRSFGISLATNFGVNELRALKALEKLSDVGLMETGESDLDSGVLSEFKALTNGVIIWHGSRVRFERPRAVRQEDGATLSGDLKQPER